MSQWPMNSIFITLTQFWFRKIFFGMLAFLQNSGNMLMTNIGMHFGQTGIAHRSDRSKFLIVSYGKFYSITA
jgi:hypothetical protein